MNKNQELTLVPRTSIDENKPIITFISRYQLLPNLVAVLVNYGTMLHKDFQLQLIIGLDNDVPESLRKHYKIFQYKV